MTIAGEKDEVPVLIAGGGMVGLSAATFLAQQGIRSVAIERLKSSSPLPRAAFFHMRTMEMFRSVGIVALDYLAGRKLADIIPNLNEGVEAVSPCRRLFLNQPSLEPILRERAREAGATVIQGAEVIGVQQDSSGVRVTLKDLTTGEQRELHAKYLIAADGAHSRVRDLLGIGYDGRGVFSNSLTIYFRADLSPWIKDNAWSIIYVNNPALGGFFRMNRAGNAGFLAINTVGDPKADPQAACNVATDLSESRLIELIRQGVGVPNLDVKIDGHTRWRATADVAQRFQSGRIFITGDAAHLMPPNGGFGGNTGIHDAHNLAWKLALVLKGQANPGLLDTYEPERKPVAKFTVEQAFSRYVARTAPWLQPTQTTAPLAHDFHIELGYLYNCPLGLHADPRTTQGIPGSRAPHIWLTRKGGRVSTHDLTGNYVLLTGNEGNAWIDAARTAADECDSLTLDTWCIGKELTDTDGRFAEAFGIENTGATLIRPDGFVAWRSVGSKDPTSDLTEALKRSLGH